MLHIVGIVAALAPCLEVVRMAIGRVMVQVRDRQNNPRSGVRVRFSVSGGAVRILRRSFAGVSGLTPTTEGDLGPVLRIEGTLVLRDGHSGVSPLIRW